MISSIIIAIIYAKSGQITAIIWIFLIPPGVAVFDVKNNGLTWIIISFVSTALVLILTPLFPESFAVTHLSESQKNVVDIFTVVLFLLLLSLFVYHRGQITNIRLEMAQGETEKRQAKASADEKTLKDGKIYADILSLFEKEKPYCNPNYTVSDLAIKLKTNVKYISNALRSQDFINFNNFINTYRIRMVKEMLNNDVGKKYTLQHIYTSSGFRNQSTFNKAFRVLEGSTPSEYIAKRDYSNKDNNNK
jgi:YesN/AraC family two-component response regulator